MGKESVAGVLKQFIGALTTVAKSKARALKARLIVYSLLTDKKLLLTSMSRKLQALTGKPRRRPTSGAVLCRSQKAFSGDCKQELKPVKEEGGEKEKEDEKEKDEEGEEEVEGSAIEMVKNSKEEAGEEFVLEEDIDRVAEQFIRNFHLQMRMQKQHSLKRHREMLAGTGDGGV